MPYKLSALRAQLAQSTACLLATLVLVGSGHVSADTADGKKTAAQKPAKAKSEVTLDAITVHGKNELNPPNSKPHLDTVTETGSRLGLTVRETPASVNVIDRKTMEKRGAYTSQEALERSPGITVSSQPGAAGSVSMRGFTGAQITQLFNGITVQYDAVSARPIDSWLLDRVEVLGGPSTFLFGQGAVGGSINYVSKLANRGPDSHNAMLSLGEYWSRQAAYGYNGRVGSGNNWVQADLSHTGSEGWFNNSRFNSGVMSFSLLSDITDRLSHTVAVEHQLEDRFAYWGTPVLNPTVSGGIVPWGDPRITSGTVGNIDPRTRFENYNAKNPVFDQQVTWVRDIIEYQLSPNTQLKNTLYYYGADRQWRNVEGADWNDTNTLIARNLSLATDHSQYLVGNRIEASHDTRLFTLPSKFFAGIDVAYNNQIRNPSLEIGQVGGLISPYGFVADQTYYDNPLATGPVRGARNELLTVAGYAESRLTLLPKLNLVAGLRVDDITLDNTNYRDPTPPSETNPFGLPPSFTRHYQPVTWRTGLMYDITPTVNIYSQYSTAASPPAGMLTTANLGQVRDFALSTGQQAEIGSKFDFWGKRGSGTVAAYWIERTNIATTDMLFPNLTLPVGAQSSVGVEANLGLQITPQWSVQGNMAYTDARLDEFNERGVSRAGNRPTNVPEWVANGWLTWDFYRHWQWNFGARFVDQRFADNANLVIMPAYAVFDMQMSWQFHKNAGLTARVKNLTDEVYAEWGSGGTAPLFLLREPRLFLMELKLGF